MVGMISKIVAKWCALLALVFFLSPSFIFHQQAVAQPAGSSICDNRTYCAPGYMCVPGGCLSRQSPRVCSNGRNYCDSGFICTSDNSCISADSGRVCSDGRSYCQQGYICGNDNSCIATNSGRVCSNGRNYCDVGFLCTSDNKCLSRESSRVCSNGQDYCSQGFICTRENKCLSESVSQQQIDSCKNASKSLSPEAQVEGCTSAIQSKRWAGADISWAYVYRGNAFYDKGDYDSSIADYDEAARLDPRSGAAYNNRGLSYRAKKEYDRAIADYSKALEIDAKDADALLNRGNAWFDKDEFDRAIADYSASIKLKPGDALAYKNRALAYQRKEDYDGAIADYGELIRIEPSADAFRYRGELYEKKKDFDSALVDYSEAIKRNPKDIDALYSRGNIYYLEKKDNDRAMADFKEGVRLAEAEKDRDPLKLLLDALNKSTVISIYVDRGDEFYGKKQYDRAIAIYNEALSYLPSSWNPLLHRAYAYFQQAKYPQAIADYDALLKQFKEDDELRPTVLYARGIAKLKNGDSAGDADVMTARSIVPEVGEELAKFDIKLDAEAVERTKPPLQPLPCQLTDADYAALAGAEKPLTREQVDGMQGKDAKNLCASRQFAPRLMVGKTEDFKSEEFPKDLGKYLSKEERERYEKITSELLANSLSDLFKKR